MNMTSTAYIDAFVPEGKDTGKCSTCGLCLQKCPVMKMGKEESREEITRLINGEDSKRVVNECTFCFGCNHFCPNGLKPYALFMDRMIAKNLETGNGVPDTIAYMFNGINESNYFTDQYKALQEDDRAILDKWETVPEKAKEILFIGCFGRTIPKTIENSKALKSLPKYAPRDACCAELPYRFGDYKTFSQVVDHTKKQLEALDTERLICYCGSCTQFLGNIWPNYHGVKLPFEVVSLWEWMWEQYKEGQLTIENTISKDIAISDSCYSSDLGDGFYDAIRGLHEAAGMKVVELENNKYNGLSCGFASGIRNNYDNTQVKTEYKRKMAQIIDSPSKDVSCYCPGCWAQLSGGCAKNDKQAHYAMNLILHAFGDPA